MATKPNWLSSAFANVGASKYKTIPGPIPSPISSIPMPHNVGADPFNWKAAVTKQKTNNKTKTAAKKKVVPKVPQAIQQAAPAPIPTQTAKEILDAFRAANGGALPPGMTPDMAALIDSGIDIAAMQGTNPAMANVMLQIQQSLSALPADYAAGKASVNATYDKLTGDILASGKNWMQDLYGRIVDPNDPNAALAAQDPALAGYAQSMSEIDETADTNQATDLAWFDKMQQNATDMYNNMLIQTAAQAATPVVAGGGGGGGGGGGRRGGRGGGGGSGGGSSTWKTPTNKLTNTETTTDTGQIVDSAFAPGYFDALMADTARDPELQSLARSIWEQSDASPRGVTQATSGKLTEAELERKELELQSGLHQTWFNSTPAAVQAAIGRLLANKPGVIRGDDPTTKGVRETYHYPLKEGEKVPPIWQANEKQSRENQLAEELLQNESPFARSTLMNRLINRPFRTIAAQSPLASPASRLEVESKGGVSPRQIDILKRYGEEDLLEAQKNDTPESKWNWLGWGRGGNYVPDIEPEALEENEKFQNWYRDILDITLPWNPNATRAPTRETLTSTGQDKSAYQSSTTNKSTPYGLPGSPLNISHGIPQPALETNPLANPGGFDEEGNMYEDFAEAYEDELGVGGLGMSRGVRGGRTTDTGTEDFLRRRREQETIAAAAQNVLSMTGMFGGEKPKVKPRAIAAPVRPRAAQPPKLETPVPQSFVDRYSNYRRPPIKKAATKKPAPKKSAAQKKAAAKSVTKFAKSLKFI